MHTTPLRRRTPPPKNQPKRVDTVGAAKFIGVSRRTLEKWRYVGGGPPYLKLGRRVLYSMSDLEVWVKGRERFSTSEG